MILGSCLVLNTEAIPNLLKNLTFHPHTSKKQEDILFTLLLILAVGLSLLSGNVKLVLITLTALLAWQSPVLIVLAVAGCGAFFLIRYLRR